VTRRRFHFPLPPGCALFLEIAYTVEVSSDLVHWSSGPSNVQEITQPDGITIVDRDLASANSTPRFIRLRVTRLQ